MNCGCGCHHVDHVDYDATVGNALQNAVMQLTAREGALSVLRNGGWEQWLRNLLLINLEGPESWGLTEANHANIQRIDLAIYCTLCNHPRFAIEIKINFTKQPPSEIKGRISEATCQLSNFAEHNIPTYVVYVVTHLSGAENSPVVERQNAQHLPPYKRFYIPMGEWPDNRLPLPHGQHRTASTVDGELCRAEVRAWLARVTLQNNPPDGAILRFITLQQGLQQHWTRDPEYAGPDRRRMWIPA